MNSTILSPLNDYVFKRLLGDRDCLDLLANFICSVLDVPDDDVRGLELVDPKKRKRHIRDKEGILDIKVNTADGKVVDIEVQVEPQPWVYERFLYYTAGMVLDQLGQGDNYNKIRRVVTIVVADHHLTRKDSNNYHHCYRLYDPNAAPGSREYPRLFEIHTLEIPKLPKAPDHSKLWEWLRFLSAREEGEFKMLTKENPVLKKAWGRLKELSADETERLLANNRQKERRDREIMRIAGEVEGLAKGRQEGRQEGLTKGRQERDTEIAQQALRQGLAIDVIAAITGMPPEEIEKLRQT